MPFQVKLEASEASVLLGSRRASAALHERLRVLQEKLDKEQRQHAETTKSYRKQERQLKETTFQVR